MEIVSCQSFDSPSKISPSVPIGGRRVLFPKETEDSDSDLGHISPLSEDSDQEHATDFYFESLRKKSPQSDYVILGKAKNGTDLQTCTDSECLSPLFVSPFHPLLASDCEGTISFDSAEITDEPQAEKMTTPHDTSNTSVNLEVHKRKTVSPLSSPQAKREKLDAKTSRVRTALFPEVVSAVPTSSFYSKRAVVESSKVFVPSENVSRRSKPRKLYLCCRNRSKRSRIGEINAGVRHNIKKPKRKKLAQKGGFTAAVNVIEKSNLNELLNEQNVKQAVLKTEEPVRQIKPLGDVRPKPQIVATPRQPSPTPDPNRKFFKSSRSKATVTVNKNIRLELDHGKLTLMQKKKPKRKPNHAHLDDFPLANEPFLNKTCITSALEMLEEDKENVNSAAQTITLKAHVSVGGSENSIHLHNRASKGIEILSPISQMCDTTSGLALCSPKRVRNLSRVLESLPSGPMAENKFFPIFTVGAGGVKRKEKSTPKSANAPKKLKPLPPNQTLLDAGQKRFGATQCPECEIVYHMGDPGEELMHLNYHNAENVLRFHGWKNERVVTKLPDARIIKVGPKDSKLWWKKIKDVLEVVNRDLGYCDIEMSTENCYVYLYVKGKHIAGCVFAEPKTRAHRKLNVDGADVCTEETFPVKCGVSRIWVSPKYRKRGVATALMDCLRGNFMVGHILAGDEVAFSSPTEQGNLFARRYFKTENYLVYV